MEAIKNIQHISASNPRRAPKSRGGCLRCKANRLKCDESKPECSQCRRRSTQCPGYKPKTFTWSTKHELLLSSASPVLSTIQTATQVVRASSKFSEESDELLRNGKSTINVKKSEIRAATVASSPRSRTTTSSGKESGTFTDSLSAIRQQLQRSTVPEFLLHLPTVLVEYYFNYVCQIFSSFDGALNPFRATVGKLWDGSAPIYYAIQSMAAAYLANHFPRMSPVGFQMQRETYRALHHVQQGGSSQFENLDKTLLTVLLIGQTTAWHDPKDLGLMHLKTAKSLNKRRLEQQGNQIEGKARRQNEFFEQCILYWDMLVAFVNDDIDELRIDELHPEEFLSPGSDDGSSGQENPQVFPHPWTGVAPEVQKLFAQVGRSIRRYRKATINSDMSLMEFASLDLTFDIDFPPESITMINAVSRAQSLEERLLSLRLPSTASLVDAGDENTPVSQYIVLAEAYRCAALLEIYKVFPTILWKRVPLNDNPFPSGPTSHSGQQAFDFLSISNPQTLDDFITSLAIHTISLLEKLPPSSGTRCLQPIVIIVAGSELKFATTTVPDSFSAFAPSLSSSIFNSITNREVDIASARQLVMTRLQQFQLSLPAKPVIKALQLIQETWARADLGQEVFWMDVMEEMGWESIFG